jgi:hypothetical protein
MLAWFKNRSRLATAAQAAASHLARWYPPEVELANPLSASPRRVAEIMTRAYQEAASLLEGDRLGLLRRLILAGKFRTRLRELGYSDAFVRRAADDLVAYLVRAATPSASPPNEES